MTKTEEMKKEIKKNPFFANRNIKDEDVLKIMTFLEEKENCSKCKKLADCKNSSIGYESFITEDNQIYCSECKYLQEDLKKKRKSSKLKMLYLPPQLMAATISGFRIDTENRQNCMKYICDFIRSKNYHKGAYIYGDVGVGKTYLLAALANELMKREKETLFVYFPDMINELKNNFDLLNERINELKNVEILIIDDFGVGAMTQWVRDSILAPILNYRMLSEKPLFISSNIKYGNLLDYLKLPNESSDLDSARLCRRIAELCEQMSL